MTTLAVIGAGYLQLPLVRTARARGLRVIAFAWPEGAVAAAAADRFYPVSIVERAKITELCRAEQIDGVCTIASDAAVPTVAAVAAALGLPGNSEHSARLTTDKAAMRRALAAAGLPGPRFRELRSSAEVPDWPYPLIVKPVDRSGSLGVTRVENADQLATALRHAREVSFRHAALVEELLTGQEVSVESISHRGRHRVLAITDKVTTGAPHFVELAHHQPSRQPESCRQQLAELTCRALDALEVREGAGHSEFRIGPDGRIAITEIAARMGGDFIGSDLVRLSTGYDFVGGVIDLALGTFTEPELRPTSRCAGVWFYTDRTPEALTIIRNGGEGVVRAELLNPQLISPLTRSADRSGYFLYCGDHRLELPVHPGL